MNLSNIAQIQILEVYDWLWVIRGCSYDFTTKMSDLLALGTCSGTCLFETYAFVNTKNWDQWQSGLSPIFAPPYRYPFDSKLFLGNQW